MRELTTVITRKGQITVPAEIRAALGLRLGDRIAIALDEGGEPKATLRRAESVVERTYGAVKWTKRVVDVNEWREMAMETVLEEWEAEEQARLER